MAKNFRCKECGQIRPEYDRAGSRRSTCADCEEWLDLINNEAGVPGWKLDWYREHFPELEMTRANLDWLQQNY